MHHCLVHLSLQTFRPLPTASEPLKMCGPHSPKRTPRANPALCTNPWSFQKTQKTNYHERTRTRILPRWPCDAMWANAGHWNIPTQTHIHYNFIWFPVRTRHPCSKERPKPVRRVPEETSTMPTCHTLKLKCIWKLKVALPNILCACHLTRAFLCQMNWVQHPGRAWISFGIHWLVGIALVTHKRCMLQKERTKLPQTRSPFKKPKVCFCEFYLTPGATIQYTIWIAQSAMNSKDAEQLAMNKLSLESYAQVQGSKKHQTSCHGEVLGSHAVSVKSLAWVWSSPWWLSLECGFRVGYRHRHLTWLLCVFSFSNSQIILEPTWNT